MSLRVRMLLGVMLFGAAATASADRILVLGDSLSAAHNMKPAEGWVNLLDVRLQAQEPGRHQVINASISGESTTGALARLPALLQAHKPDVVVIELGGNDALQGQPMSLIHGNFDRMTGLSRAAGARVAVLGVVVPPQFSKVDAVALAQMYAGVSRQAGAPLVPSLLDGISGKTPLLQWDGLHPNVAAQPLVLTNAWPAVKAALHQASPAKQKPKHRHPHHLKHPHHPAPH